MQCYRKLDRTLEAGHNMLMSDNKPLLFDVESE